MGQNNALDSDLQLRYEKYKGILKEFTLMSDIFMRNVFKKGNVQNMSFGSS